MVETLNTADWKPGRLMGRLANGAEADRGPKVHAVPAETPDYGHSRALCGAEPGRRSGGWDVVWVRDKPVTCPRCVAKLRRLAASR